MKKFFWSIFILVLSLNSVLAADWSTEEKIRKDKINAYRVESERLLRLEVGKDPHWQQKDKARRDKLNSMIKESKRLRELQMQQDFERTAKTFSQQLDKMQADHINLMNNLKTCTCSGIKVMGGYQYVLGSQNGVCYFRMDYGTQGNHILCSFPPDVARGYAEESIKIIKSGGHSSYFDNMSEKYCKDNKK